MLRSLLYLILGLSYGLAAPLPNIVILLADDAGWGDLSIHGNGQVETPALDSLAKEGASLTAFYVSPVCSPTRAEFLTGRYHLRDGVRDVSRGGERLNTNVPTLAQALKKAGYATGIFGKWHNGSQWPYHPNARGFDEFVGYTSGHWGEYFDPPLEHNGVRIRGKGYIVDDLTTRAMDFIQRHQKRPFLCYVPFTTPHSPWAVPEAFWARKRELPITQRGLTGEREDVASTRCALAMMENLDANTGRILRKLDELGLRENTIVLYFSDNGPNTPRWNGGLRGHKGSTDEGGLRSACFIRWPGRIPPGHKVSQVTGAVDLQPTLLSLAGVSGIDTLPQDGIDFSPLLSGAAGETTQARLATRLLFSHWNGRVSVRTSTHRLSDRGQLFDLAKDHTQHLNVTMQEPELTARLRDAVTAWRKEMGVPEQGRAKADDRPIDVGFREFPTTLLPARDATPHGKLRRSASAPNSSYFVEWRSIDDRIEWDVRVQTAGEYEAVIYYTCPIADVGATVELSHGPSQLRGKVEPGWDPPLYANQDTIPRPAAESKMKEFRPLKLGNIKLREGRHPLTLRAVGIPGASVMDFYELHLTLKKPELP